MKKRLGSVPDGDNCMSCLPSSVADLPASVSAVVFPQGTPAVDKDWAFRAWKVASAWCCRESHKAVAACKAKTAVEKDSEGTRVKDILEAFRTAQNLTPRKEVLSDRASSSDSLSKPCLPAKSDSLEGSMLQDNITTKEETDSSAGTMQQCLSVPQTGLTVLVSSSLKDGVKLDGSVDPGGIPVGKPHSASSHVLSSVENQLDALRRKMVDSPESVFRKPAAKNSKKRPASCEEQDQATARMKASPKKEEKTKKNQVKAAQKKPAGRSAGSVNRLTGSAGSSVVGQQKVPKGNGKQIPSKTIRVRMVPDGCARCRRAPGCTPSCWLKKGWRL